LENSRFDDFCLTENTSDGLVKKYVLLLCLVLTGCIIFTSPACEHTKTFRRFTKRPNQDLQVCLICRDCNAVVWSFTYTRPWNGPVEGYHGDDEFLQIGGWEQEELDKSEDQPKNK
jgi:hypothetical protein